MTSSKLGPVVPAERRPLTATADARIIGHATSGRLLVYAGAGISLASGLPTGAALSREIHTRLTHMGITLPEVDPVNLLAVADLPQRRLAVSPHCRPSLVTPSPLPPPPRHRRTAHSPCCSSKARCSS